MKNGKPRIFYFILNDSLSFFFQLVHKFRDNFFTKLIRCQLFDDLIECLFKWVISFWYACIKFPFLAIVENVIWNLRTVVRTFDLAYDLRISLVRHCAEPDKFDTVFVCYNFLALANADRALTLKVLHLLDCEEASVLLIIKQTQYTFQRLFRPLRDWLLLPVIRIVVPNTTLSFDLVDLGWFFHR